MSFSEVLAKSHKSFFLTKNSGQEQQIKQVQRREK